MIAILHNSRQRTKSFASSSAAKGICCSNNKIGISFTGFMAAGVRVKETNANVFSNMHTLKILGMLQVGFGVDTY